MSRLIRPFLGTVVAVLAVLPLPPAGAAAETEITTGLTQFVPAIAQVSGGSGVAWVNKEVTNYPVLIGNHNIVPDTAAGALPDTKPFPTSSPLIAPGGRWACTGGPGGPTCTGIDGKQVQLASGRYAYMCGLHPNHMHGILVVS
jgi:plastocyanin